MSLETQIKAMEIRIEAARGRPRTKANINKALYFLKWKPKISIENGIKSLLNE